MRGFAFIGIKTKNIETDFTEIINLIKEYKANMLVINNTEAEIDLKKINKEDLKDVPILKTTNLIDSIPFNCIPVIVKKTKDATLVSEYNHPERAFYLFCDEDQNIDEIMPQWLRDNIYFENIEDIETAKKVEIVLKDRYEKNLIKDAKDQEQKEKDRKTRGLRF